jgi:hypothetical protein
MQAWTNFCQNYQSKTITEFHKLEWQFICDFYDENLNPEQWLSMIEILGIRMKIDHKDDMSDNKMIAQVHYYYPFK